MAFLEDFVYPFIILLIGAALAFVITRLTTERYQRVKDKTEQKHKVSELAVELLAEFKIGVSQLEAINSVTLRSTKAVEIGNILYKINFKVTNALQNFVSEEKAKQWVLKEKMAELLIIALGSTNQAENLQTIQIFNDRYDLGMSPKDIAKRVQDHDFSGLDEKTVTDIIGFVNSM